MLLHRPAYHVEHDKPFPRADETQEMYEERYKRWEGLCEQLKAKVELFVVRNSYGRTGAVQLDFDVENMSFIASKATQ